MTELKNITAQFNGINLDETSDKVALLERIDSKYMLTLEMLPAILKACRHDYKILEINQKRLLNYETTYYDTSGLDYYHAHHSGHLNRIKIRVRKYINTNTNYLEVKHKNNKGITRKTRQLIIQNEDNCLLELKSSAFINLRSMIKENLLPAIQIDYTRITLVNSHLKERVTIDIKLCFKQNNIEKYLENYVVAEVKQEKQKPSFFKTLMKHQSIKEGSISKYCLGITQVYKDIKKNHFLSIINKIEKKETSYGSTKNLSQHN